jgi:transmembrane sensor
MSDPYQHFTPEDFATDDLFRTWILEGSEEAESFWTLWLQENPHKREDLVSAVVLLQAFKASESPLSRLEIDSAIEKTIERIETSPTPTEKSWLFAWTRYAAVFVLVLLTGWVAHRLYWTPKEKTDGSTTESGWVLLKAGDRPSEPILLSDGSRITLTPFSSARFLDRSHGERLVVLEGSAFFDVSRIPGRPFKVMTDAVMTEVLGTSFNVITNPKAGITKVQVITGKVEVTPRDGKSRNAPAILSANQEISYSSRNEKLVKVLVEAPVIVTELEREEYLYEEEPVSRIFSDLEKRYGVKINFDAEKLSDCQVTASFTKENFWETLNLVCRPIRATIQEKDGEIYIESQGCDF